MKYICDPNAVDSVAVFGRDPDRVALVVKVDLRRVVHLHYGISRSVDKCELVLRCLLGSDEAERQY